MIGRTLFIMLALALAGCDDKVKVTIKVKTVDAGGATNATHVRASTVTSTRSGVAH
jgi:hypothetical protein